MKSGDPEGARGVFESEIEKLVGFVGTENGLTLYYRAQFAAVTGETDAAFDYLRQAADNDFYDKCDEERIFRDLEFDGLRDDPRFGEIMN